MNTMAKKTNNDFINNIVIIGTVFLDNRLRKENS